jgi:hypothetical protein
MTMNLKETDDYLLVKDNVFSPGTFNKKKPGNSGIVYCNYIPVQLTPEEAEKRKRAFRVGKTYATVCLDHPNPFYRGKRGIVWETSFMNGEEQCLLEIETWNRVGKDGFSTLVGVVYPTGYTKIWFPMDVLEKFEEYDEKGELKENEGKGT